MVKAASSLASCAVVMTIVSMVQGYILLEDVAHIQLNDASGGKSINASTLNRVAFDQLHNIVYVLSKEPRRLTAFSVTAGDQPMIHNEVQFPEIYGQPLDVEMCRPKNRDTIPRIAISFTSPVDVSYEGTVRIYKPYTALSTELELLKEVTVGPEPVDMEFAQDCMELLVVNRGRPSVVDKVYNDPEGTISNIQLAPNLNPDSPTTSFSISFFSAFAGDFPTENIEELRSRNFRVDPLRDPSHNLLNIMQNMEPERVVISPNGEIAFVSLPKNNAIARIQLQFDQVSRVFPLGNRSWSENYLDPSDKDNRVEMRSYNMYSLMQAREMTWLSRSNEEYIVTLDSGMLGYTPSYKYADHMRAKDMMAANMIQVADNNLAAQLRNDSELGRLFISKVDGRGLTGKIEDVFAFGGRGFSVRDANSFNVVTEEVDGIEQRTEQYLPNMFNTAYVVSTGTPQSNKEATSPSFGPDLAAMAKGDFEGRTVLFMGGGSSGIIYVYSLSPTAVVPQFHFESLHRWGDTYSNWNSLYTSNKMGDIGITDMLYVESPDIQPLLVVTSASSNSVSFYSVTTGPFSAP